MNRISCIICITLVSFTWCFGQNNKSDEKYGWVNLGFGGSSVRGISGGISGSYQNNFQIISLRAVSNQEIAFWGIADYKYDIGFLYGLSAKRKFGFVSISTGISYVGYNTIHTEIRNAAVGIPIEIQLFLTAKVIGIGFYGFANINRESSFIGFLGCIQIGKLR